MMWVTYFKHYLTDVFPRFLNEKPWNYKNDLCIVGARDLTAASGDKTYLEYVRPYADHLLAEDGSIRNFPAGEHNIDKVSFAKSLRIYRDLTGDDRFEKALGKCESTLFDYPRTETGNFWHKDIYPNQVWLDGLYMGLPVYAAYSVEHKADKLEDILGQFRTAHSLLYNPALGLYMHANDCSRRMDWANPVTGQSPTVWLRAEGWFLMALVDVYEIIKEQTPAAKELCEFLSNALLGLLPYQQAETKMFLQIPNLPDEPLNYPETSGSAMVAYALMKGARLGMIPVSCWHLGEEILTGIEKTYLRKDGENYYLYGTCASAGLGPGPDHRTDRDGTIRYYLSEKQMVDNQHGAAACMMAFSEYLYGAPN